MSKFANLSIKAQLSCSLGLLMVILAMLKYLASIVLVLVVTGNISSYAEDYVADQISRHSGVLLTQNSNLMVNYLNIYANGLIQPAVISAKNTYRDPFVVVNDVNENYFNWDLSTLAQPTTFSQRQQREVSLIHSAYKLPYVIQSNLSSISQDSKDQVGQSNYLDFVWINLYNRYEDMVSIYAGFSMDGLFRQFPGVNDSQTDRSYDPRARPWYADAVANKGTVMITSPYDDASGLGRMVTFAQTFEDPDGNIKGVVGGDLLIQTLVESIQKINLYKTGNMILIQTDKVVIVNKDGDTSFLELIDVNVPLGETKTVTSGNYVYIYQKIKDYGEKYILIAKVDADEIQAPLEAVRENMQGTKIALILTLLGIFLGILVLTVILIIIVVRGIVKPIEEIMKISDDIINDIGKGPKKQKEVAPKKIKRGKVANIEEVGELRNKIDYLKVELEKNRQLQTSKMILENKFYGKPASEIPWNIS